MKKSKSKLLNLHKITKKDCRNCWLYIPSPPSPYANASWCSGHKCFTSNCSLMQCMNKDYVGLTKK